MRCRPGFGHGDGSTTETRQAVQAAPAAAAAPAPPAPTVDLLSELERLGHLHESGVLSDAEFVQAKAAVLGGPRA